nr:UDP-N-acetylglucosamine 2-epimerase (non-hydrolyzing) [uncultured Methanospirillum sp.]
MITIIIGTRPEIIKMAPVIRACEKYNIAFSILHTGQHYSYEMDRVFFEELLLPLPNHNLDVGSGSHAEQTASLMTGIEQVLVNNTPDVVLVQGDTNTVLAGGLVGAKLHIPVGHVEAGLRSYDRTMPEEINRVVVDHVSDYLFAPTKLSTHNLIKEGIEESKIYTTGNTVVDSLFQNLTIAEEKSEVVEKNGLTSGDYLLVTVHRAENVDYYPQLSRIITGIQKVSDIYSLPVIFPMHPRTQKMIQKFRISTDGIKVISPVSYLDFLKLEKNARMILTDSGGVQEEACILQVPCVTLRENTERPETVDVKANILAGSDPDKITAATKVMISSHSDWINPYGDGNAGERIVEICESHI